MVSGRRHRISPFPAYPIRDDDNGIPAPKILVLRNLCSPCVRLLYRRKNTNEVCAAAMLKFVWQAFSLSTFYA
jgi:hypothetical protein